MDVNPEEGEKLEDLGDLEDDNGDLVTNKDDLEDVWDDRSGGDDQGREGRRERI